MSVQGHIFEGNDRALMNPERKWYAVYTAPRAEKQVSKRLLELQVEAFLPLHRTLRQWSDRKRIVEKPLLSSYVFVHITSRLYPAVFRTSGVIRFVSFEGIPVPIPQKQIDNLKLLVNSDAEIGVTCEKLEKGDSVEVTTGSLTGLTGELVSVNGKKRVVIRIDRLDQNIIVKIPLTFLRKL